MKTASPFTWTVKFTVAPLWVQDGFAIDNDRALAMLRSELGAASEDEASAEVLHAPSALHVARIQGYGPRHPTAAATIAELKAGCPEDGKLWNAIVAARELIDSVAFVARPGDTAPVIAKLDAALALMHPRQGEAVEVEA